MSTLSSQIQQEAEKISRSAPAKAVKKSLHSFPLNSSVVFDSIPPPRKASDFLKAKMGWVHACVDAIADEVANIQISLFQIGKNKEPEEVKGEHPILDVLNRANDFTTRFDLLSLSVNYLELAGEAPWFIGKDDAGVPRAILLLRPDRLTVLADDTEKTLIKGYEYDLGRGKKFAIAQDELVLIKYPDPNNIFRGRGTLVAAARTVDIDNAAEQWNLKFFINSARPDSIFTTENKLTKAQLRRLKKDIKSRYGGVENSHKTFILENGLDWKPMAISQKDMDFIEQQKFSRDKILSIFRVPKTIVAISDDVNRANAEAAQFSFARWTIQPKMRRIIEQLNEFFVPLFPNSENLFLDFKSPVPEDEEKQAKILEGGVKAGFITPNEAREAMGLPQLDKEADLLYLPLAVQPIGSPPKNNGPDKSKSKIVIPYVTIERMAYRAKASKYQTAKRKKIEKAILKKTIKLAKVLLKNKYAKATKKAQKAKKEVDKKGLIWEKQMRIAEKFEGLLKARVIALAKDQLKRTLAKLPRKQFRPDDILLIVDAEINAGVKIFLPIMRETAAEEGQLAIELIDPTLKFDVDNPLVRQFIKARTFSFTELITQETNKQLKKALAESIRLGEGAAKTRRRVRDIFQDITKFRAERIARTEILTVTNLATEESFKQGGIDTKEWLTALDERTSQRCLALNGKQVSIDGKFKATDDTILERPPLHPNCRCTLIPVV